MSAGTAISLEEYLAHSYEPDCEYVDGQLVERNGSDYFHGLFQTTLGYHLLLSQAATGFSFRVVTECRALVLGGVETRRRYRIPDLAILPAVSDPTSIILAPPLAVVEILSPEDRFAAVVQKCAEYGAFGVPEIWIVDPRSREVWTVRAGEALLMAGHAASFQCAEGEVRVDFNEVFASRNLN